MWSSIKQKLADRGPSGDAEFECRMLQKSVPFTPLYDMNAENGIGNPRPRFPSKLIDHTLYDRKQERNNKIKLTREERILIFVYQNAYSRKNTL